MIRCGLIMASHDGWMDVEFKLSHAFYKLVYWCWGDGSFGFSSSYIFHLTSPSWNERFHGIALLYCDCFGAPNESLMHQRCGHQAYTAELCSVYGAANSATIFYLLIVTHSVYDKCIFQILHPKPIGNYFHGVYLKWHRSHANCT